MSGSYAKGLAGRYAGALHDLASEAGLTQAVQADLAALQTLISENAELKSVISSPVYARDEQAKALNAILEKAGAQELTRKFIGAVADNGRLFALSNIISAYDAMVAAAAGQVSAEVTSAVALDEERQALVEKTVASLASADDVALTMKVDPSLIGGLVVRIGSKMFDTSIKTKLNRLEMAMKGVA